MRARGSSVASAGGDSVGSSTRHVDTHIKESGSTVGGYQAQTWSSAQRRRASAPSPHRRLAIPLAPTTTARGRTSDVALPQRQGVQATAHRRSSSALSSSEAAVASHNGGTVQVELMYRIVSSSGRDRTAAAAPSDVNESMRSCMSTSPEVSIDYCNVEQRVVLSRDGGRITSTFHGDGIFGPGDSNMTVSDRLVPQLLRCAMDGQPQLVAAAGMARSGKTATMFNAEGLFLSHVQQLLSAFAEQRLTDVFSVRLAFVCVTGTDCIDLVGAAAAGAIPTERVSWRRMASAESGRGAHGAELVQEVSVDSFADAQVALAAVRSHPALQHPHHFVALVHVDTYTRAASALVREVAPVCFAELNARVTLNRRAVPKDNEKSLREDARNLFAVLEAGLRRSHMRRGQHVAALPHVPWQDSPTALLLKRFLVAPTDDDARSRDPPPVVRLLLHLDQDHAGKSMESVLELAQWLLEAKYPAGVPSPDYRAIAHAQQREILVMSAQLQERLQSSDSAADALRKENIALAKAYEAMCARVASQTQQPHISSRRSQQRRTMPPPVSPGGGAKTPNVSPARTRSNSLQAPSRTPPEASRAPSEQAVGTKTDEKDAQIALLRHQMERLNELLVSSEHEVSLLRAQLHHAGAMHAAARSNDSHKMSVIADATEKPEVSNRSTSTGPPQGPAHGSTGGSSSQKAEAAKECDQCLASTHAAGLLIDALISIERAGLFDSAGTQKTHRGVRSPAMVVQSIAHAKDAIGMLVRQCCERERAFECLIKRTAVHEILGNMSVARAHSPPRQGGAPVGSDIALASSPATLHRVSTDLNDRSAELRLELRSAPLLGWQKWRDALRDIGHARDNIYADCDRACLLDAPARSTEFHRWWSSTMPFSPPTPAGNKSVSHTAANRLGESPVSKLDQLLQDWDT